MSYCSRVYNHRNAHTPDVIQEKPFFSKRNDTKDNSKTQPFFQAKLAINKPGDQYEREADSVANSVVNNKSNTPVVQQKNISSIQRLSTSKEDEKLSTNEARMEKDKEIQEKPMPMAGAEKEKEKLKGVQKKEDPLKEKEKKKAVAPVQKKSESNASTASPQVSSRIESSAGKGNALPAKTLSEMNSSFGVDFSNVNIHKDSEAANMNQELQAQAFTHGNDIYFNSGKYNPENSEGKFLLAHELTHVVQQGNPNMLQKKSHSGKRKIPQNFICYTGGHTGVVSVFKDGVLIFSGPAVSGQPGSKQNEKDSGPTPDGIYVIHPQKRNSPVTKAQSGRTTCGADSIGSGFQELSSNEKIPCEHPSHYCSESCAESPINNCFTPVGCWGEKRIKIEGSASVIADDGKRIRRSGFYFHGGNPSNLASSGCIKVLNNDFFSKARELKGKVPVFIGNGCPGFDPSALLFSLWTYFD